MILSARWATGLPGYRRLPTISAEARLFELEAVLGGACATSFLSFFCGEAYALRLLGCFRLGRRWFRGFRGASGLCFWLCRLLGLAFGLELIERVRGHRELEFPLKGCTYCHLCGATRTSPVAIPACRDRSAGIFCRQCYTRRINTPMHYLSCVCGLLLGCPIN